MEGPIVIFLGPSLALEAAQQILDALYLPPAAQGDLMGAVALYRPQAIGLIDGVFYSRPAVWHKEILYALSLGIPVYGASSMGALRAAETADFGMVGIGEIYRLYASGELNDDDEVALAHASQDMGYRKLSEPMVNMRVTLYRAKEAGVIDADTCEQLVELAKKLYFLERSFELLLLRGAEAGIDRDTLERVREFSRHHYVDLKGQDAVLLLETLRDLPRPIPAIVPNFQLEQSPPLIGIQSAHSVRHESVEVSLDSIVRHAALHAPDFFELQLFASNLVLVELFAESLGVEVSPEAVQKETTRFRLRHRLTKEADFSAWLVRNDLSMAAFQEMIRTAANCRRMQDWLKQRYGGKNITFFLNALRLQNRYEEWARQAALQKQLLQDSPDISATTDPTQDTAQLVIEHLRATKCSMDIHYREWLVEAGFQGETIFNSELMRAKQAREKLAGLVAGLIDQVDADAVNE